MVFLKSISLFKSLLESKAPFQSIPNSGNLPNILVSSHRPCSLHLLEVLSTRKLLNCVLLICLFKKLSPRRGN